MAFTVNPVTGNITFGVVSDGTNDAIARDLASEFGVSEDFKDTFNVSTNWTQTGTKVNVNTGSEVIDWDALRDGTNHAISHDLGAGNVSDTQWVLRFKWTPTVLTSPTIDPNIIYITLSASDDSVASDIAQDHVAIAFQAETSPNLRKAFIEAGTGSLNVATDVPFTDDLWSVGTPVYVELKRTSTTSYEASLFSDDKYTTLIENISSVSIDGTVNDLRFIKIQNRTQFATDGLFDGTIDNVQFWNATTTPRITSLDWRIRFKLNITNLDDGANTIDKRLWMSMSDSDETVGADSVQDSINLFIAFDTNTNRFILRDTNGQAPDGVGNDALFTPNLVTVSTKFVEIKRTSSTAYDASLFSDSTFTTLIESQSGTVNAGTTGLRYIKFMNGGTLVNGAGAIDGTIDDFVYTDFEQLIVMPIKTFIIDAVLEGCTSDFCEDFNEYAISKLPFPRDNFNYSTKTLADLAWISQDEPDNQVDVVNENFFFTVVRNGTNTSSTIDLGTPVSDERWTLRCKVVIGTPYTVTSGSSSGQIIGLYDTDSSVGLGSLNDLIHMALLNSIIGGGSQHSCNHLDNGVPDGFSTTGTTTGWVAGDTRYIELRRLSPTLMRSTIYTDANFSVILDRIERVIPSTVGGLRFIKFGGPSDVVPAYNGVFTGTIDNIEFWDEGTQGDVTFQDNFLQKPVTFSDDFVTDQWTDTGTTVFVDTANTRIDATDNSDGTYNATRFDLTSTSDTEWTLRFKIDIDTLVARTTTQAIVYTGLFDNIGDDDQVQDAIVLMFVVGTGTPNVTLRVANNIDLQTGTTDLLFTDSPVAGQTRFYELKRTSATTVEASVYSDATYSTLIETVSGIIPSGIVGTNFLMVKTANRVDATAVIKAFIEDIEYYNGTSTLTRWLGATGNDVGLDTVDKRINFDIPQGVLRDELLTFDLQTILDGSNASDDNWTLRFKINTDNIAQGTSEQSATLFVGLDDGLLPFNTTGHDLISFRVTIDQGGAGPQFGAVPALREVENGQSLSGGSGINFPFMWTTGTLYVELKRLSPTLTECTLYTDATFRNVFSSVQLATTATLINLRYIRLSTDSSAVANDTVWDGSIDDIEFYNGVSVPRTPIEEVKDHEDNFIADNYTNINGTKVSVNTATQVIDWSSSVNAVYNEGEFNDIIGKPISTDRWTLRCKLVINTVIVNTDTTANDLFIGFSDSNTALPQSASDFIGWRYSLNNPNGRIRTLGQFSNDQAINGAPGGGGTIYSTPVTTGTFYLETSRNGSNITGTIYSDPDFTQVIEAVTSPIDVGITGLRFLKIMVSNVDGSANHTYDGTIDNIQFWDGQSAKDHENRWRKIDL